MCRSVEKLDGRCNLTQKRVLDLCWGSVQQWFYDTEDVQD
jgi:hypothetical protein